MRIPVMIQMQPGENGVAALTMMLGFYRKYLPMSEVRDHMMVSRNGSSPGQIVDAARYYGLDGCVIHPDIADLGKGDLPLLIQWKKHYYCIVKKIDNKLASVIDPAKGEYRISTEKLKSLYTGSAIKLTPSGTFCPEGHPENGIAMLAGRLEGSKSVLAKIIILTLAASAGSIFSLTPKKDFIDEVMKNGRTDMYVGLLVTMALFFLFQTAVSAVRKNVIAKESRRSAAVSGAGLFKKLFSLPYSFFEQHSAGELVQRVENNIDLNRSLLTSLAPRLIDFFMIFAYLGLMFSMNARLGLFCFGIELLYVILSFCVQDRIAIANRSLMTSNGQNSSTLFNGLNMIGTLKACGMEQAFFNEWTDSQESFRESNKRSFIINAIVQMFSGLHLVFERAVLLFAGAYYIICGSFTIGMMSVFESAMLNVSNALSNTISGFTSVQSLRTNLERVDDIMERESDISVDYDPESDSGKLRGILEVRNVSYKYNNGDDNVVDNISFTVKQGEIVALVGRTGCGKSTLLKMIGGYYTPASGTILYDGMPRSSIADVVFHSSVASVDQENMVFDETVKTNLQLWDRTIQDYDIILASRAAQIHDRIMQDKNQYNMMMLEKGSNFSGGERQRLELARALARDPVLLCLDEFTNALDTRTENDIFSAIREEGITCIMAAHRRSAITNCDYIYVIDGGRIVQSGTHEELFAVEGLYRDLLKEE